MMSPQLWHNTISLCRATPLVTVLVGAIFVVDVAAMGTEVVEVVVDVVGFDPTDAEGAWSSSGKSIDGLFVIDDSSTPGSVGCIRSPTVKMPMASRLS